MILRTHICKQERLEHRIAAPFVVGCGTHVSPVVARIVVIAVLRPRCRDLFVLMKCPRRTLGGTVCVFCRQMPCHPVGQPGVLIVRHNVSCPSQKLLRKLRHWCRQACKSTVCTNIRSIIILMSGRCSNVHPIVPYASGKRLPAVANAAGQ